MLILNNNPYHYYPYPPNQIPLRDLRFVYPTKLTQHEDGKWSATHDTEGFTYACLGDTQEEALKGLAESLTTHFHRPRTEERDIVIHAPKYKR